MRETLVILGIIAIAFIFIFSSGTTRDRMTCYSKTENMGFNTEWSIFGGCRIEVDENKWIPLENYRQYEE